MMLQARPEPSGQARICERTSREVHGNRNSGRLGRHQPDRQIDDAVIHISDEIGLLCQRDELVGKDEPAVRMLPSCQRLKRHHPPVRKRHHRLQVHDELVGSDRCAQLRLDRCFGSLHSTQFRSEDLDARASCLLGSAGGEIGVCDRLLSRVCGVGTGDPDRHRHQMIPTVQPHGESHLFLDTFGQFHCAHLGHARAHDNELIGGDASNEIPRANRGLDSLGDQYERIVTCSMSELVIGHLEFVDVNE